MSDWNCAEREQRLWLNPTLDDCRRMGSTHHAYGWSCTPQWPETERQAAYREGYESAKRAHSQDSHKPTNPSRMQP